MDLSAIDDVILLANHYGKYEAFISPDIHKFILDTFTGHLTEGLLVKVDGKGNRHPAVQFGGVTLIVIPELQSESFCIPNLPFPFSAVCKVYALAEIVNPKQMITARSDHYIIETQKKGKDAVGWEEEKHQWND